MDNVGLMTEFDSKRTRQETTIDRFDGHAYVSGNGKLVVDKHASDEEHLMASPSRDEHPLYDCRSYVDDVVPKAWHGKRVNVEVKQDATDGVIRSVQLKIFLAV